MSGMILGSMIEADSRMRAYEHQIRLQRRIAHDRAVWEQFELDYPEVDDAPRSGSGSASGSSSAPASAQSQSSSYQGKK